MSSHYEQGHSGWHPDVIPQHQKKWLKFLSLRFGAMVSAIAPIACFAWAYTQHRAGEVSTDGLGASWSHINLGTAAYAFAWSTLKFLVVLIFNCAIHPGITIAFDCIAWVAQLITICFYLIELGYWHAGGYGYSKTGVHKQLYGAEVFGCSMMLLEITFHFILMCVAASACHTQRKAEKPAAKAAFEGA
ncbi:hypothetical protein N7532_011762 [Penicillium argentinense]|uniref:Uncharacterized protein n=1 Tax=Penicillium argentinense TaxID=1131581 RepID=A0A9W9EJ71_9EURO|nr:uncharacterized protein N7532_011762 [Penicillium argentinense]KAJ5082719.1 hypothetical protein N7532_011762 [Penicillium argentinense]